MARSNMIWMILDEARSNTWWDNMMSNNSEWKENFRLSQPTNRLLLAAFCFARCRGNKQFVNHFIMNDPRFVVLCKRLGIRISF